MPVKVSVTFLYSAIASAEIYPTFWAEQPFPALSILNRDSINSAKTLARATRMPKEKYHTIMYTVTKRRREWTKTGTLEVSDGCGAAVGFADGLRGAAKLS